MNDFSVQDPVTLVRMSGQDIVDAIVKELRGDLMQDMSKLPPGTIAPMSEKEFKDYQSQLAMQATTKMVVPTKPSAEEFAEDFDTYISIQKTIDDRMGKSIIQNIQGKPFRKKAYWRAVATAFRLTVKKVSDEYFEHRDDWGYHATWVAITETGREVQGEGSFQASEKMRKDGSMVDATHHNVRSTANTRAFNRAVSNCVGFGEVSAEEIGSVPAAPRAQKAPQKPQKAQEQASRLRPKDFTDGYEWDGNLVIGSGKNKGKKWSELPLNFLEWTQGGKAEGVIVEMGAKELARRAALEGDVVDAEVTREPGDDDEPEWTHPRSEDPRYS